LVVGFASAFCFFSVAFGAAQMQALHKNVCFSSVVLISSRAFEIKSSLRPFHFSFARSLWQKFNAFRIDSRAEKKE
jgi:hypothetical protein